MSMCFIRGSVSINHLTATRNISFEFQPRAKGNRAGCEDWYSHPFPKPGKGGSIQNHVRGKSKDPLKQKRLEWGTRLVCVGIRVGRSHIT